MYPPPRIKIGRPFTKYRTNEVPRTAWRASVNWRIPNGIACRSDVLPFTEAVVESRYRLGVPNWYGHQRSGCWTCNAGYCDGSNTTSRFSLGSSVTVWAMVIGVFPGLAMVASTVVVTGWFVPLTAST